MLRTGTHWCKTTSHYQQMCWQQNTD